MPFPARGRVPGGRLIGKDQISDDSPITEYLLTVIFSHVVGSQTADPEGTTRGAPQQRPPRWRTS